jgi:ribonuclease Z
MTIYRAGHSLPVKIVFLGTSGAIPSVKRNLTSTAIQLGPEVLLFDCAEGTQRQFMASNMSFMKVEKVFITHFHGDHFLGLPGLLQSMSFMGRDFPISIYGPEGMIKIMNDMVNMGYFARGFDIGVEEVSPGDELDFPKYTVRAIDVEHGVPCLGYILEESTRTGRFDLDRARELDIPEGPLYRRLQAGEVVELDGREISPEMVIGPPRRGRKVVITGDTAPCETIVEASKGADVLIHESTYASDMEDKAREYGHSTASGAAEVASRAKVRQLYLTHISNRYDDVSLLEREARRIFPDTTVAEDLMSVEVPTPDENIDVLPSHMLDR